MRKPIAILVVLVFMGLWIWAAGSVGSRLSGQPGWVQLVFFVIAGLGWILPLRPLFLWMNKGQTPQDD